MKVGDVVGGRYRIERLLGEGGMASVWWSHDRTLDRPVAIKFLYLQDGRKRQSLSKAFLREARLAASVVHRNIVQVLDFGLHAGETPFMVMEALEGESLGEQFNAGAQYSLAEVIDLGIGCLEGLSAVHDAGIVHRDLKPENIFIAQTRNGIVPKLLDFGISRSLDTTGRRVSAVTTVAGRVLGTPEYMSPEQANGAGEVTARSDVYAAGVILYETIVGDVPYRADHLGALIVKITQGGAPPVVSAVPEAGHALSAVIERAMKSVAESRYADATEMLRAWQQAADETRELKTAPPTLPPRSRDRAARTVDSTLEFDRNADAEVRDLAQATTPWVVDADAGDSGAGFWRLSRLQVWLPLAVSLLAIAAMVFWIQRRGAAPEPEERFIVVQAAGGTAAQATTEAAGGILTGPVRDSADDPAAPSPSQTAAVSPGAPSEVALAPKQRRAPRTVATARPRRAAAPEATVTRAFDRQKVAVVRCLETHAQETVPKLAVRMTLGKGGRVAGASVLPESVGRAPVGACIQRAVQRMRFPTSSEPATYRVPLVARASL